ncbi:protein YIPF5-like protein [Iris pallida]|uniref:Protein YIP n=1 Tax=Iris pallida TaxID=29817 RepID=A0AAX6HH08_IRIPA|nr:protein YIPF5-like protein [Iris pallida]
MAKEFNVPPVIFPSSLGGVTAAAGPQNRRAPTPSFTPNPNPNANLPFLSFDIGSTSGPGPISSSSINASHHPSGGFFDDEPPLLEELGINTGQIWSKTLSILNPFRPNPGLHADADLFGPFLLLMAFGLFQLLAGKLHFGIILGWLTVCSLFIYLVFNMLAGRSGNLDLYRCFSLVGYCMLPIVVLSALSLFVPRGGMLMFGMAAVFVLWSTRACTRLLVEIAAGGDEHRGLIAYACWLIYTLFSLLVVF